MMLLNVQPDYHHSGNEKNPVPLSHHPKLLLLLTHKHWWFSVSSPDTDDACECQSHRSLRGQPEKCDLMHALPAALLFVFSLRLTLFTPNRSHPVSHNSAGITPDSDEW